MYRLCWKHKLTGEEGRGEPIPRHIAEAWVERLNRECPDTKHWIEPADFEPDD